MDDDLVFCTINVKEKVENRNCCKNTSKINLGPRKNGMTTTCIQLQKFTLCEPTTLKLPYAPCTLTELFRDRKTRSTQSLIAPYGPLSDAQVVTNPLFKAFQENLSRTAPSSSVGKGYQDGQA